MNCEQTAHAINNINENKIIKMQWDMTLTVIWLFKYT